MSVAIVTGSSGLIGSESVRLFSKHFDKVIGIDNDMRSFFFGKESSNRTITNDLVKKHKNFKPVEIDIRDYSNLEKIFIEYSNNIELIIHTAAQPSHDWAAKAPIIDFNVNANGTLNLLELMRSHSPEAVFIYTSTNKVYGDSINQFKFEEKDTRYELESSHNYFKYGVDESLSVDNCLHSLFGVSKLSGDILTQEYGKYFNLKTGIFRGGCLTGGHQSGAEMHGFLNYLVKCNLNKINYKIYGYKGKQVRDNIHSSDLVEIFNEFRKSPKNGEVYNIGGSRFSNCSILEAIDIIYKKTNIKFDFNFVNENRTGDHIWWVSDIRKFKKDFPNWNYSKNLDDIIDEIIFYNKNS